MVFAASEVLVTKVFAAIKLLIARMLAVNEVIITRVLAANKIVGVEGGNKLIEKSVESKIVKLSKAYFLKKCFSDA